MSNAMFNPSKGNCYDILEIPPEKRTPDLVGRSLRQYFLGKALAVHPDKNAKIVNGAAFDLVRYAFDILDDPITRAAHDAMFRRLDGSITGAAQRAALADSLRQRAEAQAASSSHSGSNTTWAESTAATRRAAAKTATAGKNAASRATLHLIHMNPDAIEKMFRKVVSSVSLPATCEPTLPLASLLRPFNPLAAPFCTGGNIPRASTAANAAVDGLFSCSLRQFRKAAKLDIQRGAETAFSPSMFRYTCDIPPFPVGQSNTLESTHFFHGAASRDVHEDLGDILAPDDSEVATAQIPVDVVAGSRENIAVDGLNYGDADTIPPSTDAAAAIASRVSRLRQLAIEEDCSDLGFAVAKRPRLSSSSARVYSMPSTHQGTAESIPLLHDSEEPNGPVAGRLFRRRPLEQHQ